MTETPLLVAREGRVFLTLEEKKKKDHLVKRPSVISDSDTSGFCNSASLKRAVWEGIILSVG